MQRHWTLLVYMAGDNGREFEVAGIARRLFDPMAQAGHADVREMAEIGTTDKVAIAVQFDTPDGCHRFAITPGAEQQQTALGKVNTGDPNALSDFIAWGIKTYPAERIAVILWNHGTGWKDDDIYAFARQKNAAVAAKPDEVRSVNPGGRLRRALFLTSTTEVVAVEDDEVRGICYDDSSLDFLDNAELQAAFRDAEKLAGRKIDLIGMDACLMSMVEVAYQLRGQAEYLVASQEVEPMAGWPYRSILAALDANPTMGTRDLAKLVVTEYGSAFNDGTRGGGPKITQSAIKLAAVDQLAAALTQIATALGRLTNDEDFDVERAMNRAQRKAVRFKDPEYVDLADFLRLLREQYTGDDAELNAGLDAALPLLEAADDGLVAAYVAAGDKLERARGLSIYLPDRGCSPFYAKLDFETVGWGTFLRAYNEVDGS